MRKTFELEDLDCANCAAKMEEAIKKLPGVKRVSVNFMTQKMILEAEETENLPDTFSIENAYFSSPWQH